MKRVLVVEDEASIREMVALNLKMAGWEVVEAPSAERAMELFFRNPGTALVREKILEGVWGKNYFGDVKIVDVNIRRLRMKIEDEPSSPQHILTVWGYGYRWNA